MWKSSLTTLFVIVGCGLATAAQQKPVHETRHDFLTSRAPESPEKMADSSQAVVLARLVDSSTGDDPHGGSWLVTTHTLEVVEVLKADVLVPLDIEVMLFGGEKEEATRVRRDVVGARIKRLQRSRTYLLFLNWNDVTGVFVLPWGTVGIFDVTEGTVSSMSEAAKIFDGFATPTFLARARQSRQ